MSTEGNDDTGDGSIDNPYLSIMKCQDDAESGDIVYIRGGTYTNFNIAKTTDTYNYIKDFIKSGITYKAYESEKVIFDFEFDLKYAIKDGVKKQRVTGFMIEEGTENVTFENFDITRIPTLSLDDMVAAHFTRNLTQSEFIQSRGRNIRFNRINTYKNYGIGFYFVGVKSYNIAYRCDSYNNSGIDSATKGNADGFGAHGTGAEFIECRAWDNSDDNYDCINSFGTTIFDKSWSFKINYKGADIQDGNGFKVGGWGKSATARDKYGPYSGENPPVHIVKNCIAASNKANGFYSNHQPGQAAVWYNNRAYNNKANFDMTEGSETWELDSKGNVKDICGTREVLYFNIGYKYNNKISSDCNMYGNEGNLFSANIPDKNNKFNSWNFRDITLSNSDFLILDVNELAKPRGDDGSLPEISFMKLNPLGSNYAKLKTIEEEIKNYELKNDGTIVKINQNPDDSIEEKEEEKPDKSKENTENSESTENEEENNDDTETSETEEEAKENTKSSDSINGESEEDKSCPNILPNCEKCTSNNKCISCKEGFYLIKEGKGLFSCKNIANINQYFKINEDGVEYYKKCIIENCDECSSINYCTKCIQNFAIIEDAHSKCELCNNGLTNCEKCFNDEENNNKFKCQECKANYALKHSNDNNIECALKNTLESDNTFYTNDEGINYYSCSSYNDALYCSECNQKEICSVCQSGFSKDNNGKTCYSQNEVTKNEVIFDSNINSYIFCKDVMAGCNTCKNTTTCDACKSNLILVDDDKCLPESDLISSNHYILFSKQDEKGEIINKYISCSIAIEHCETCTSNKVCTSCSVGYNLNNDKLCEKIKEKNNDDDLSTGSIVGIVIGCVGFLIISGLTAYFFLIKKIKPDLKLNSLEIAENVKQNVNEIKDQSLVDTEKQNEIIEGEKQSEVFVHKTKRGIHN